MPRRCGVCREVGHDRRNCPHRGGVAHNNGGPRGVPYPDDALAGGVAPPDDALAGAVGGGGAGGGGADGGGAGAVGGGGAGGGGAGGGAGGARRRGREREDSRQDIQDDIMHQIIRCWEFYEASSRIFHIPFEYLQKIIEYTLRYSNTFREKGKQTSCPDYVHHHLLHTAMERESEKISKEAVRHERSCGSSSDLEGDCSICLEKVGKFNRVVTPCGHLFCFTCMDNMTCSTCPICRRKIRTTNKSNMRYVNVSNHVSPDVLYFPANMAISTIILPNHKRVYVMDSSKHLSIPKVDEPILG